MHKNALFKKNWKIAAALGAPPPIPVGLRRLGAPPQTPELLLPSPVTVIFLKTFVELT